jgi:hypothetical protein
MPSTELTRRQLLEEVRQLSGVDSAGLLRVAGDNMTAMTRRVATAEDAETCRLAMLAGSEAQRYADSTLWHGRALARFVALDWHSGAAAVLMTDFFRLLGMANQIGYQTCTVDQLQPAPLALELLAELRPFTRQAEPDRGFGPTPRLILRFIEEKSGFALMLGKDWDGARACYLRALDHVSGERRGEMKVPLGLALVDYLADRAAGRDGAPAARRTADLIAHGDPTGLEFLRSARTNLDRMADGRVDLLPYELL